MAASPRRVLESQLCAGGGGLPLAETRHCSVLVVAGVILDFPSSLNLLIAVFVPFQSYYWIPRRRTRVLVREVSSGENQAAAEGEGLADGVCPFAEACCVFPRGRGELNELQVRCSS